MPSTHLDKRTLSIERTFNTTVQQVWDAWANTDQITKWWGPPGMQIKTESHDFQPDGHWKFLMPMPNGMEFITDGKFEKIEAPHKIKTTANFRPMTENVILHVHFEEKDGNTRMTFHCVHPTEEYCNQQEEMGFYKGWGSTFDRLEQFLGA